MEVAMSTALAEMSGPEVDHQQNHGGSQRTSKVDQAFVYFSMKAPGLGWLGKVLKLKKYTE